MDNFIQWKTIDFYWGSAHTKTWITNSEMEMTAVEKSGVVTNKQK
ncbi:hypothetical protein [Carboxylicivirga marina]|nr:hypothetical protein [Carboxylicivirga marina]